MERRYPYLRNTVLGTPDPPGLAEFYRSCSAGSTATRTTRPTTPGS